MCEETKLGFRYSVASAGALLQSLMRGRSYARILRRDKMRVLYVPGPGEGSQ